MLKKRGGKSSEYSGRGVPHHPALYWSPCQCRQMVVFLFTSQRCQNRKNIMEELRQVRIFTVDTFNLAESCV